MPRIKFQNKFLIFAGILLLLFFICEILAYKKSEELLVGVKKSYSSHYQQDFLLLEKIQENWISFKSSMENVKPHPFWGYQYDGQRRPDLFNNFGFKDIRNFPYVKGKGEFVIGFFGGSVAEGVALEIQNNFELQELIAQTFKVETADLIVLNFALGGAKQPQQYSIASFFVDFIDVGINLDGFNEIVYVNQREFPLEFPANIWFINQDSHEISSHVIKLERILQQLLTLKKLIVAPLPFKWDPLTFVLWKNWIQELENAQKFFHSISLDDEEFDLPMVNIWEKYTRLQLEVFKGAKKKAFFFLQPNQYVENSKQFDNEERAMAIDPLEGKEINRRYIHLRETVKKMKNEGIPITDLTQAFQEHKEHVYIDKCCHLNSKGNKILAKELIQSLSQFY